MRVTQGAFSFLPDLADEEIHAQVQYCIDKGWAVSVEYTDDPHPRNSYWEMWGHPMFDNPDAAAVVFEFNECRKQYGDRYIRILAFEPNAGRTARAVDYIARAPGGTHFLGSGGATLALPGGSLHIRMVGAATAEPEALQKLPGIVNSLVERVFSKHRVSIAQVGHLDLHQRAELGLAAVGIDGEAVERVLDATRRLFEDDLVGEAWVTRWDQQTLEGE